MIRNKTTTTTTISTMKIMKDKPSTRKKTNSDKQRKQQWLEYIENNSGLNEENNNGLNKESNSDLKKTTVI